MPSLPPLHSAHGSTNDSYRLRSNARSQGGLSINNQQTSDIATQDIGKETAEKWFN